MTRKVKPDRTQLAPGLEIGRIVIGVWQMAGRERSRREPDHALAQAGRFAAIAGMCLGRVPVLNQPLTISAADRNLLDLPHRRRLAGSRRFATRLSVTER